MMSRRAFIASLLAAMGLFKATIAKPKTKVVIFKARSVGPTTYFYKFQFHGIGSELHKQYIADNLRSAVDKPWFL